LQIILLGAPGAGKGTQAVYISQNMGLAHIASGDLFRKAQNEGTELGLLAKSFMEKGQLVPDDITVRMILERIDEPDCEKGFILDGFPRTLEQAQALDNALSIDKSIDKAVYIKVSTEELVRRLSGRWICKQCQTPYNIDSSPPRSHGICDKCRGELYQRDDDKESTIRNRLDVYFNQTMPLIEYYHDQGKLLEANGEQQIEEVAKELVIVLQ
jgi:adenylate kinase